MSEFHFPAGFKWGVSTAAYQIEGAAQMDGRGPSIWDTFSHTPGNVIRGETGDVATDHYHRLDEDLDLLANLGVDVYRFSLSWSRVLPDGAGAINPHGLDFYDRLIDGLIARGIQPVPTLYHWDLPQALHDQGGWESRQTISAFGDYAELVGERYSDRVDMWTTINEPWVATYLGYALGVHAPGIRDLTRAARVHHHLLLAHSVASDALRRHNAAAQVGIALNMSHIYAALDTPATAEAARVAFDQLVGSLLDPLQYGRYPTGLGQFDELWAAGAGIVQDQDLSLIQGDLGFLSINEYHPRYVVAASDLAAARLAGFDGGVPSPFALGLPYLDVEPNGSQHTSMGWLIEPRGLRDLLISVSQRIPNVPLFISENGCTAIDYPGHDGRVDDPARIEYLATHLRACSDAIAAGVDLRGYFLWSFLDNFEWAEGYAPRFGIVYVDYPTQSRTPKSSYHWYQDTISRSR